MCAFCHVLVEIMAETEMNCVLHENRDPTESDKYHGIYASLHAGMMLHDVGFM